MKHIHTMVILLALALLWGCTAGAPTTDETDAEATTATTPTTGQADTPAEAAPTQESEEAATTPENDAPMADVTAVEVSGEPGSYTFSVRIESPDTGCDQYADWWEVISDDGSLLYRRILAHSHVDEQPFTRSGGPIQIDPDTTVWVRAHMNPGGYGGTMFMGSVESGFQREENPPLVAPELADEGPQPDGCAY
jgi:hypothetical protein